MKRIAEIAPGMLVCIAIAAAATMLVKLVPALEIVGAPVFGILIGIALGTFTKVSKAEKLKTGISYTSKKFCRLPWFCWALALTLPPWERWE